MAMARSSSRRGGPGIGPPSDWARNRRLNGALEAERHYQATLFLTEDFAEGRAAFLGKRTPEFKGR